MLMVEVVDTDRHDMIDRGREEQRRMPYPEVVARLRERRGKGTPGTRSLVGEKAPARTWFDPAGQGGGKGNVATRSGGQV